VPAKCLFRYAGKLFFKKKIRATDMVYAILHTRAIHVYYNRWASFGFLSNILVFRKQTNTHISLLAMYQVKTRSPVQTWKL
jgi:hypothetical protein